MKEEILIYDVTLWLYYHRVWT